MFSDLPPALVLHHVACFRLHSDGPVDPAAPARPGLAAGVLPPPPRAAAHP